MVSCLGSINHRAQDGGKGVGNKCKGSEPATLDLLVWCSISALKLPPQTAKS